MKCRACWADRAEVWRPAGWRGVLPWLLLLAPVKCRHCLHCSWVPLWRVERDVQTASGTPTAPAVAPMFAGSVAAIDARREPPRRAA